MTKNKIALITGASRGIGAATTLLLAENGYDIAINYLNNEAAANAIAQKAKAFGVRAITIKADIAKEDEIVAMFETIDHQLGPITALVNNGGIGGGRKPILEIDYNYLNKLYSTNLFSTFLCSREAIKRMQKNNGGAIVNVSSLAAKSAGFNMSAYASSKAAINNLTIGLSREVAEYNIRVNAVAPGVIDTDIHQDASEERLSHLKNSIPLKRLGEAKEVAETILWLLSNKSSYVTGSVLEITGGK